MKIETQRLIIREFSQDDLSALFSIVSNHEVMKFSPGAQDLEGAQARLEGYIEMYRTHGYGKWAVTDKGSSVVLGYCGFGKEEIFGKEETELGYRFLPEFWGMGYATEAATACLEFAMVELNLPKVVAFAHTDNVPSIKVLNKIGMKFIGNTDWNEEQVEVFESRQNKPMGSTPAI